MTKVLIKVSWFFPQNNLLCLGKSDTRRIGRLRLYILLNSIKMEECEIFDKYELKEELGRYSLFVCCVVFWVFFFFQKRFETSRAAGIYFCVCLEC